MAPQHKIITHTYNIKQEQKVEQKKEQKVKHLHRPRSVCARK